MTAIRSDSRLRGHLPALDGLRGLAILAVMLLHFAYRGLSGAGPENLLWRITDCGWVGVDLFFVLSGFLITGILLDSLDDPHYFRNFYVRRTLRIFPLYFGALALIFFIWPTLFHTPDRMPAGRQLWVWLYATNFMLVRDGLESAHSGPLVFHHFWSLAVEEHFYLIWPALVLLCGRRKLIWISLLTILAAMLVRTDLALHVREPGSIWGVAAYHLTFCRMDALAMGALLAAIARGPLGLDALVPWCRRIVAIGAVGLLIVFIWRGSLFQYDRNFLTFGLTALAGWFAAILVLAILAPPASATARFFSHPFLRMLGKYSYGLYVFHYILNGLLSRWLPIDELARGVHSHFIAVLIRICVGFSGSMCLALLSWHLYEKHFLRFKRYFEKSSGARGGKELGADSVGNAQPLLAQTNSIIAALEQSGARQVIDRPVENIAGVNAAPALEVSKE
jgi:peptidoglycan/LPS O-acetylase OafA/YrhL